MAKPKISIIIPVYNSEEFLEGCLNSIINQSINDIEVICINDGSLDNSLDILKKYKTKDNRIKIFSQVNKGPASARNEGIKKANGEYTLFVDSDDWIESTMCEELYNHAKHLNSDLVLFDATEHNLEKKHRNRVYFPFNSFKEDYNNFTFNYTFNKKLVLNYFLVIWSKMYKTEFVKKIEFPNLPLYEDIQFHVESMLLANKISYFPKLFYHYRKLNVNSEQNFKAKTDKSLVIVDVFEDIYNFLLENNFFNDLEINFFTFVFNESRNNLNNINIKYKNILFKKLKTFYNSLDINHSILKELPFDLYGFYIHFINAENYFEFKTFQDSIDINLDNNELVLLDKIMEKNEIIRNYEKKLLDCSDYHEVQDKFYSTHSINTEAYHKIKEMNLFDEDFYRNHEGYSGKLDPLLHYIYIGYEDGKNPCKIFNSDYYMNYYDSVKESGLNPLVHFVMYGLYEGKVKIREDVWQPPLVLNKFDADTQLKDVSSLHLNDTKRSPQLIVSLTSYPARINIIKYAILSIFNQSLKPDKVVLWLADSQFPNKEKDIPLDVLKFLECGLEIKWCDDIKSYKKLIPSLREFPNDIIVTFDDDIYVEEYLLEKLYSFYLKYPNCVIANRTRKLSFNDDGSLKEYQQWELSKSEQNASFLNFFTGAGGVLYPPNSLDEDVFNMELANDLTPSGDDIWFWAMAVKNGTKIKLISDNNIDAFYISPEMEIGLFDDSKETLWKINANGLNNIHMDNVLNRFPEIKERVLQDFFEDKFRNYKAVEVSNKVKNDYVPIFDEIKVATIMDQFTYDSYKYECNLIYLRPHNWVELLEKENPDLFLCESAFHGLKTKEHPKGEWVNKIHVNLNNDVENREILFSILEYCDKNNIPTVFWNKEDPSSFYDDAYNFVDTALYFDYIFTTDEDCIPRYLIRGHEKVNCLMFATQPKLFNPIKNSDRSNDVVFAGSWYKKFEHRCAVMKQIFDKLLDNGFNLKIYDRMYELHYDSYAYPNEYQKFLNPGVHFNQMPNVYKESNLGLNINTVTESPTMFARRVFELMSSNTLVFSNYSKAVDLLFGDDVIFLDKPTDLDGYNFENIRENNLYNVLENHTYSNRFRQILDTVGIKYTYPQEKISLVYSLNDYSNIGEIISHFNSIDYPNKYLKIMIPLNFIGNLETDVEYEMIIEEELNEFILDLNDDEYICFVNYNFNHDFIKKALLHFKYIPKDFGIFKTDEYSNKFTFDILNDIYNVVFSNVNFKKILNQKNEGLFNINIYNI